VHMIVDMLVRLCPDMDSTFGGQEVCRSQANKTVRLSFA
jgi:hypothetical protein